MAVLQKIFLMENNYSRKTRYWHRLDEQRVQCDLCPRECKLHEGQRGLCYIRGCEQGEVVLYSYGRSSGFCIDPIEKKPLNHFYPGSAVLSFGTAGCNLACKFCQNWDMSKSREMDTLADKATPLQLAEAAVRYGCSSIAYTYNDPVIFLEYALDVAAACRERGVNNVAVTAGYIHAEPRSELFAAMDAANVDLKSFNEDFYHRLCGAHLSHVLDTLQYIKHHTSCWLELTTLLIPDHNDSDQEISAMTRWVVDNLGADVPMHFSAFHPDWKMRDVSPTPAATLHRARKIAMDNGVQFAYTGNLRDLEGGSTWCPNCKQLLIGRDSYRLYHWGLENGHCGNCGRGIAGHFGGQPGDWGCRRQVVHLAG